MRILPLLATAALLSACQAEATTIVAVRSDASFDVSVRVELDDIAAAATKPALDEAKAAIARFAGVKAEQVEVKGTGAMSLTVPKAGSWDGTGTGVGAVRVTPGVGEKTLEARIELVEPVALLQALDKAADASNDPQGVRDTLRQSVMLAVEVHFPGGALDTTGNGTGTGIGVEIRDGVAYYRAPVGSWQTGDLLVTGSAEQKAPWWQQRWLLIGAVAVCVLAAVRYDRRRRLARSIGY